MKNLRRHFTFAPDTEITLEANPDDITADKLALWRDLGINRLSLGVQSFDEAELRLSGDGATRPGRPRQALSLIRAAGFTNLGLDLMYGLPGQTPGRLAQDPGDGPELRPGTSVVLSAHPGAGDSHGPEVGRRAAQPPG